MKNLFAQERYLVVSHLENDRPFRIVGSANKNKDEIFFSFFLRLMPGMPYYIVPHRDRVGEYLVFSGRSKRDDGSYRFFCKIGSAVQLFQKNVIEIHLPDLRQVYYLKLEANDLRCTENRNAA